MKNSFTRGLLAFVVFGLVYFVAGVAMQFSLAVFEGTADPGQIVGLINAVIIGAVASLVAVLLVDARLKVFPRRGLAITIAAWFAVQYIAHFIWFAAETDFALVRSMVQNVPAIVVAFIGLWPTRNTSEIERLLNKLEEEETKFMQLPLWRGGDDNESTLIRAELSAKLRAIVDKIKKGRR